MRKDINARMSVGLDSQKYSNKDEFFNDVSKLLQILTNFGYQCSFRYEDCGIYVLEFDYDDPEMGTPMIYWLDNDQLDCLYTSNYIKEDDEQDEA